MKKITIYYFKAYNKDQTNVYKTVTWFVMGGLHASLVCVVFTLYCKSHFNFHQFLPEHEQWSERVRKRLYYGIDSDSPLDALSCPMTGESTSKT